MTYPISRRLSFMAMAASALVVNLLLTSCTGANSSPTPSQIPTSKQATCSHLQPKPGPVQLSGLAYGPYHGEQTPDSQFPSFPSSDEIQADMQTLKSLTHSIRIYSSTGPARDILDAAQANGIKVALGISLTSNLKENEVEIAAGEDLARTYTSNISSVIVGNEVLQRGDLTEEQLHEYLQRVHTDLAGIVPITMADIDDVWMKHSKLARDVDFITIHIYPFWSGISIDCAIQYVAQQYQKATMNPDFASSKKKIVIGETGWPSDVSPQPEMLSGTKLCAAQTTATATPTADTSSGNATASPTATATSGHIVASPTNQALYLKEFATWADQQKVQYYFFSAFDEAWKTSESGFGTHWGLYQQDGQLKPALNGLLPSPDSATLTQRSYRDVAVGGLEPGFDVGIDTSQHKDYTWLAVKDGVFTLTYPSNQDWGTMFITVCKAAPPDQRQLSLDLQSYHSLVFEMRSTNANRRCIDVGIKDWKQPDDGSEQTELECPTTEWIPYTLPLSLFSNADPGNLYVVFEIVFHGATSITVQVRNVRYSPN